jgi:hypothetical protein
MGLRSSLAARGIAVAGLAITAVVGCTGTRTGHTSAPKPLPTSTITSAAELIARAFERECAQFSTTYSVINTDVTGSHTSGALVALMAKYGGGWQHALSAAAQVGSGPGVPTGANIARSMAAYIAHDAIDLSKFRAEIGRDGLDSIRLDSSDKAGRAWNRAFTDLTATQSQC